MSNTTISNVLTEEWPVEIEMKSTMIQPGDLCETHLAAIICCPCWFPLGQVVFGLCCMNDPNLFYSEAKISFHDQKKELNISYWNYYFPCCMKKSIIPYSSIDDVAAYVEHNTTYQLDNSTSKRDTYFPVVITKDGTKRQLYQMGTLNWKLTAKRLVESNQTFIQLAPSHFGGFWSINFAQGLHHFFFGRMTRERKPVVESAKYFVEGSYRAPTVEAICIKHTNTEYTETVYSSA